MQFALRRGLVRFVGVLAVGVSSFAVSVATGPQLAAEALRSRPNITMQPKSLAVDPGQPATFTAAALGSPAPTVRWQAQTPGAPAFATIAGATSTTLTISNVTSAMSGSQYQAVFSNPSGSATTSAATLIVTGTLDHLVLSPASAAMGPGGSQIYRAEGFDAAGNDLGDMTGSTTFTISDGLCTADACTASTNGTHTITATDGSATGTASLSVGADRFVELIFSRSEVSAADGVTCQPNDTNIARLDTVVGPYLQSMGLAATGSIQTGPMMDTANWCTHSGQSEVASWAQLQALGSAGWTFVTHSSTYPNRASKWSAMTPTQQWDETCGAAQAIDAHGLHGASDMYLWPNNTGDAGNINTYAQSHFVEPCFGTERFYGASGLSTLAQLATAPHEQAVIGLHGGSCIVSGAPCYRVPGASHRYLAPASVIAHLQALQPGQVLALQSYVLVTGTNPAYTTSKDRWDCTSPDPNLHWANDAERYCYSDWQTVISYLASSGLGITQPGVVAAAAGRSGYSDTAITRP